jgi:hypothetical protein
LHITCLNCDLNELTLTRVQMIGMMHFQVYIIHIFVIYVLPEKSYIINS